MQKKTLTLRLAFSQSEVRIVHTIYGVELSLVRGQSPTQPGAPCFPVCIKEVALPEGMEASRITSRVIQTHALTCSPTMVAPIREKGISPINSKLVGERQTRWVPPNLLQYEKVTKDMTKRTAWLSGSRVEGRLIIAGVAVRPVRYDEFGCLELVTELRLTISLRPIKLKHPRLLRAEQRPEWSNHRYNLIARNVINPEIVKKLHASVGTTLSANIDENHPEFDITMPMNGSIPAQVPNKVDYLIITDENSWDAESIAPKGLIGDLPGAFRRLANWKRDRGLRTYIASINDIVSGSYGNFKTGARDLQEVLRNFLKDFVWRHDTNYVLLGGCIDIIPVRRVCGSIAYGCLDFTPPNTPLTDNTLIWKSTFLGMRVDARVYGDPANHILTMLESGQIVPYDINGPSGTASPRWYHTTDDTFTVFSQNPTAFIRVDGTSSTINGKVQWYRYENLIPSDLYYSSLYAPTYDVPGRHDWDLLGNGLYGQWSESENLDGLDYWDDVSIGRAPIENVAEADIFIDKVIDYEKSPERPADGHRFNRMLLVGEHFGDIYKEGHIYRQAGDSFPPNEKMYSYEAANSRVLLNAPIAKCGIPFSLLSHVSGDDYRLIPYNPNAGNGNRGWFYTRLYDNITPNGITFDLGWYVGTPTVMPNPTQWIAIYSDDETELTPENFLIDEQGLDVSIQEQENLRELIAENVPSISEVRRLYSHEGDLGSLSETAAPLRQLSAHTLRAELNDGPHLVSMSGHGWYGGCCQFDKTVLDSLTNGDRTFIIFADSCYTNEFDYTDPATQRHMAISRYSLVASNGGAVAYIGYSRSGWQSNGPAFLLGFFEEFCHQWPGNHLGFMCGFSRGKLVSHHINDALYRWTGLAQNLMGDPEMNVYRDEEDLRLKYVANKNTKELHERNCPWVAKMWTGNKLFLEEKEWALNHGYDGCAFCLNEYHTC